MRKSHLESICKSATPSGKVRGDLPYRELLPRHIRDIRDEWARVGADAANGRLKALRGLFKWAKAADRIDRNPAAEVPTIKPKGTGYHAWTLEEVLQFLRHHRLGTPAHKALAVLLFTGARRSDAVRLGEQMVGKDRVLRFTEVKGRARKPKHRALPLLPQLRAAIEACPSGHLTWIVTKFGRPYSPAGFYHWFKRRCADAGLPAECCPHGVRKAGATILRERGATNTQLRAIYGWTRDDVIEVYAGGADLSMIAAEALALLTIEEQTDDESVPLGAIGGTIPG
jgi:integrase